MVFLLHQILHEEVRELSLVPQQLSVGPPLRDGATLHHDDGVALGEVLGAVGHQDPEENGI